MQKTTADRTPTVSVIIPSYNTAALIATCLDSVFAQTYRDFEVIVVNDGSPDSEQLENTLGPYLDRLCYSKQENGGPSAARNRGILEARGHYVAFVDSDDYWFPPHLATQMELLQKDPALGLVYGDSLLTRNGRVVGRTFDREMQVLPVTFEALLKEECTVSTSATVALRKAVIDAGLFDDQVRRCEDYDLWLRMAFRGTPMRHHKEITVSRNLGSGLSANGRLMTMARMQVLAKLGLQLPLTPSQRELLAARQKYAEGLVRLDEFKENVRAGDFELALSAAQSAAAVSWKLRVAIPVLHYAPQALRSYYRAHERWLEARNRARAARSERTLKASLPQLSGDARNH